MGKMMYDEGMKQEALVLLKRSNSDFGGRYVDRAKVLNSMACCYLLSGQNDSTEICLKQSLEYASKNYCNRLRHDVLNNYAVLSSIQGKHRQAITCLRQIGQSSHLDTTGLIQLYTNFGDVYLQVAEMDSAALFYDKATALLSDSDIPDETKVLVYGSLSQFARAQGDNPMALYYMEKREEYYTSVMQRRQEQSVYRIQQQYDYENILDETDRKIANRHRIIIVVSILLFAATSILLVLQNRHKKLVEAETELKAQIDTMKQDLRQAVDASIMDEEIASRLQMILTATRIIKRAKDQKSEWQPLVNQVMCGKDTPFDAARTVLETAYPDMHSIITEEYPNLTEAEAKVCLLSFSNLSNAEMAELSGLTTNTVNQSRSTLRKKLNLDSNKMKEQLQNTFSR